MKIAINKIDQGAFDAADNRFMVPGAGTYLFGATLLYKVNASTTARMRGRLVLNGTTEIRGSFGESSATHVTLATAVWLQTMSDADIARLGCLPRAPDVDARLPEDNQSEATTRMIDIIQLNRMRAARLRLI